MRRHFRAVYDARELDFEKHLKETENNYATALEDVGYLFKKSEANNKL